MKIAEDTLEETDVRWITVLAGYAQVMIKYVDVCTTDAAQGSGYIVSLAKKVVLCPLMYFVLCFCEPWCDALLALLRLVLS